MNAPFPLISLVSLLLNGPVAAEELAPVVALELGISEGNPRNSEGDFVRLKDGGLLFIYTRFTGGGDDHDRADLVSRVSADGGVSWSDHDAPVVGNEGGLNVMSVSLLRLHDGRIALFYLQKNSLTDCRPVVRFSSDEAVSWSAPTDIIPESGEDLLLAYVAGEQAPGRHLSASRITRLPLAKLRSPTAP